MRLIVSVVQVAVVAGALVLGAAPSQAQTILGNRFDLKDKPGYPQYRKLAIKAQEVLSPENLVGDPVTNGAVIQLILNGATPSTQTITLPGGARWKAYTPPDPLVDPKGVWKYRESRIFYGGRVSPVSKLQIAKSSSGKLKIQVTMDSRYVTLDVVPPNPGTYAGMVITVPNGGSTFCTNFGGIAGGTFARNDAFIFRVAKPTAEGTCPSGTPVCGDGIVDAPFETCDVGNDAACPGLCGANGLGCLCPFCGDATIDPGESCDTQSNLGSCTEGCSYQCTCAVCGDGVVQNPVEECDNSACYGGLQCAPPGAPNQCLCPVCGDGVIAQGEQCEPTDDSACPGLCQSDTCLCAVCGNGIQESGEECDGDGCGSGACLSNCTCSVCGNGVVEGPAEQCEAADDSACPGLCNLDCICGVCGNNFTDYPQEQCDGTDDGACPGSCQPSCTCP
jgi:hypothetical protein